MSMEEIPYDSIEDLENNKKMAVVEGIIGRVSSRQFNGKNFYSFALNGQDGWYGTGIKRPPPEGTSVRFESKKTPKGYLEVDGAIEIRTDGEAGTARISSNGSSNTSSGNAGVVGNSGAGGYSKKSAEERGYWDRKEQRDLKNDADRELGASRNTALNIIDLMIKHEAVKFPAVAKREEFIWTLLDKYTAKLMEHSSLNRLSGMDKGTKSETSTPEAEPSTLSTADENNEVWN
jgi:hypothetical protein